MPIILKGPGNSGSTTATNIITQNGSLPPDPVDTAPNLDLTVATNIYTATQFIYTGNNPIQIEMSANIIKSDRVAVLRGTIRDRNDDPIPGVMITVLDNPDYGCTFSRADGAFRVGLVRREPGIEGACG